MGDLLIREMAPGDVGRMTEIYNQRHVAAMTIKIPYTTEAERSARFASSESQRMLIAERDGRVVGHGGLTLYARRRAHVGSIGMAVDQSFHWQGVGTALLGALVDLADNWYNLRRLELEVYTDNASAIRLYQRFGFSIEGTHRAYAFREGVWADAHSMARLRNEPSLVVSNET